MFTLTIKTDNAAFRAEDDDGSHLEATQAEVARIPREVAALIVRGITSQGVRDGNGNKVGSFSLEIDD